MHFDIEETNHIAVLYKGYWYRLDLKTEEEYLPLNRWEIESSLLKIMAEVDSLPSLAGTSANWKSPKTTRNPASSSKAI